jgi:thiamine phosphate synthase YjbQ (UPF0047 family)
MPLWLIVVTQIRFTQLGAGRLVSVLLGRSVTVPLVDGELQLGQFGRIYFADLDQVRARQRTVRIAIVS